MVKQQILVFLLRWLVSSAGMWLCITWFGQISDPTSDVWIFIVAGLIFSLVNAIVKPIVTLLALPLIIVTMGIFTIIVNAAMVGLTIWILPGVSISLGGAILSSLVMSLINGLVNFLVPSYTKR